MSQRLRLIGNLPRAADRVRCSLADRHDDGDDGDDDDFFDSAVAFARMCLLPFSLGWTRSTHDFGNNPAGIKSVRRKLIQKAASCPKELVVNIRLSGLFASLIGSPSCKLLRSCCGWMN